MDLTLGLIVLVSFVGGIFAGKFIGPDAHRIKKMQKLMEESKTQHETYKEEVASHFSQSADLFGEITQKYRSLYEHMSSGAYDLCDRRSIPRELTTSHVNILAVETPEISPKLTNDEEPVPAEDTKVKATDQDAETSDEKKITTDELMVDVKRSGLSPLDHDSQKLAMKNKKETDNNSAEVIDLDSQRNEDDSGMFQAKDYAIKAKGVINHNSLNRDDVKI